MSDTLLAIGGGAAAISAILGLCGWMMRTILRAYTRDADIALAQRETQRSADDAAQTKRIDDVEAELITLEKRLETVKATTEENVTRIVRLETLQQNIADILHRLENKMDALADRSNRP